MSLFEQKKKSFHDEAFSQCPVFSTQCWDWLLRFEFGQLGGLWFCVMEVTPQGLYDVFNLWNCSQFLGLEEPQSDLQSALDGFMSEKNVVFGKVHSRRWTKLFSVSKWLSVHKYVTVWKNLKWHIKMDRFMCVYKNRGKLCESRVSDRPEAFQSLLVLDLFLPFLCWRCDMLGKFIFVEGFKTVSFVNFVLSIIQALQRRRECPE